MDLAWVLSQSVKSLSLNVYTPDIPKDESWKKCVLDSIVSQIGNAKNVVTKSSIRSSVANAYKVKGGFSLHSTKVMSALSFVLEAELIVFLGHLQGTEWAS